MSTPSCTLVHRCGDTIQTGLSAQDCLAIATMLQSRHHRDEALTWVDRGLAVEKTHPHGSMAGHHLATLKRELLRKLGRGREALEEAWAEFREHPNTFSYEDLMRYVPKAERAAWHARAMDVAAHADLGSLIELWLATREIARLAERLRTATDAEIEDVSHHWTAPAAMRLEKLHPDVAAKVYRALGMRILSARKSKYYDAARSNLEDAQRCYERSGLHHEWEALVTDVRGGTTGRPASWPPSSGSPLATPQATRRRSSSEREAAGQREGSHDHHGRRPERRWDEPADLPLDVVAYSAPHRESAL